mgnify:CR=1 FL=1
MPPPKGGYSDLPAALPLAPVQPSSAGRERAASGVAPVSERELQAHALALRRDEMARLYHALGQDCLLRAPALAHSFLLRSLAVAPPQGELSVEVLSSLGSCCLQEDNPHDSVRYLRRALDTAAGVVRDETHAKVLLNLCAALNLLGKHAEALQQAELAIQLLQPPAQRSVAAPEQRPSKARRVHVVTSLYQCASCHEYLGDTAAALKSAERGLSLASELRLPADDEVVQRLRATKKDLSSRPAGERKSLPPKQPERPRKPPTAAAEVDATTAMVASLVDAKARAELQAQTQRDAAREAAATKDEAALRELAARQDAEMAAADAAEQVQGAQAKREEALATVAKAEASVAEQVAAATASAAREHQEAVQAVRVQLQREVDEAKAACSREAEARAAAESEVAVARAELERVGSAGEAAAVAAAGREAAAAEQAAAEREAATMAYRREAAAVEAQQEAAWHCMQAALVSEVR